jgi:hypothetical protein
MIQITQANNRFLHFVKLPELRYSTNPNKLYFEFKVGAFNLTDFRNRNKLFERTFYNEIHESQIFQFIEDFNEMSVEDFFKTRLSENLLQEMKDKAEKYVSLDIPEPVPFTSNEGRLGEFIEVDSETNFCGNYENEGKKGCFMWFSEKGLRVVLDGTDDLSYNREFGSVEELREEVNRLRKIQPINEESDILPYYYRL